MTNLNPTTSETKLTDIAYSEYSLRTAKITKVKPVVKKGIFDGLAITVDDLPLLQIKPDGKIVNQQCVAPAGRPLSLDVVDTVVSVIHQAEDCVQSFIDGFIRLILNGGTGTLKCSRSRLSQMDKVLLSLITKNANWELELGSEHINLKAMSLQ
jgi:hypothetical protein